MYVKWFDTGMLYYVIFSECHCFTFLNFPQVPSTVRPDVAGNGTRKTDAGNRRRTLPGTLQEGHRGSAGQGKRRRDPGSNAAEYSRM
ncbi:unnamed protein product [Staurois parvus]|uniref:Uncharacterized protein n=1 Tax=Staurois parvus TaxID=386267 RepID=A0ABN9EM56_9NEOB|nr:unnamed protein product [Staurois parvus]